MICSTSYTGNGRLWLSSAASFGDLFPSQASGLLQGTTKSSCLGHLDCPDGSTAAQILVLSRFVALNVLVVLAWWRSQRIDEDEHGGVQALMGEGLPPSIGLFLVRTHLLCKELLTVVVTDIRSISIDDVTIEKGAVAMLTGSLVNGSLSVHIIDANAHGYE